MAEEVQKKRSPWVYVGLGCLTALFLLCGVGLVIIYSGWSWAQNIVDPAKRETKARREAIAALGAVPEGYSAALSFGFPMVFDMVLFIDAPLPEDGGVPLFDRQFIFMRFMETERTAEMKRMFESSDAGTLTTDNLKVDSTAELGRGNFEHLGRKVRWIAMKGRLQTQNQFDRNEDSVITQMLFDCPGDVVRIGTWQMREPEGGYTEPIGTVADPAEMQKLLAPLSPCGK